MTHGSFLVKTFLSVDAFAAFVGIVWYSLLMIFFIDDIQYPYEIEGRYSKRIIIGKPARRNDIHDSDQKYQ